MPIESPDSPGGGHSVRGFLLMVARSISATDTTQNYVPVHVRHRQCSKNSGSVCWCFRFPPPGFTPVSAPSHATRKALCVRRTDASKWARHAPCDVISGISRVFKAPWTLHGACTGGFAGYLALSSSSAPLLSFCTEMMLLCCGRHYSRAREVSARLTDSTFFSFSTDAGNWSGVAADRREQGNRQHPSRDQGDSHLCRGRSGGKEDCVALAAHAWSLPLIFLCFSPRSTRACRGEGSDRTRAQDGIARSL